MADYSVCVVCGAETATVDGRTLHDTGASCCVIDGRQTDQPARPL